MSLQVCKDRLDPLADRGKVHVVSGLVGASGTHDRGVQLTDRTGERPPGIALVTDEHLASGPPAAPKQLESDLALVAVGRGQGKRPRGAVRGEDRVQPQTPRKSASARRNSRSRRPRQAPSA